MLSGISWVCTWVVMASWSNWLIAGSGQFSYTQKGQSGYLLVLVWEVFLLVSVCWSHQCSDIAFVWVSNLLWQWHCRWVVGVRPCKDAISHYLWEYGTLQEHNVVEYHSDTSTSPRPYHKLMQESFNPAAWFKMVVRGKKRYGRAILLQTLEAETWTNCRPWWQYLAGPYPGGIIMWRLNVVQIYWDQPDSQGELLPPLFAAHLWWSGKYIFNDMCGWIRCKTSLSLQNIIDPILTKRNKSAGKWHYAKPSNSTISIGCSKCSDTC